ncbi:MAG TPA: branched-chain-amino-acid transaminase [Nevskiaceae bacterium]|nr:branched-chain-amino-acid transaminase [Nevskiaceae bacterium]
MNDLAVSLPAPEQLGFGTYLAPVIVSCEHDGQRWSSPVAVASESARLPIASGGLQYGLSVFEGLKAYRNPSGGVHLFRPLDHARRLAASARRLHLPEIPEALFVESCRMATRANEQWLPPHGRGSHYLRPTILADEEALGLRPAKRHRYTVTISPSSDPPLKPMRLWAEPEMIRAAPGGLGAAKTGANYAAGLGGLLRARELGYDDVLWLDAREHRVIGEAGTMNLFVQIGSRLLTPRLDGTILAGITRDSILKIAAEMNIDTEEATIDLETLANASASGALKCVFASGTAARIARITEIGTAAGAIKSGDGDLPQALAARLKAVQEGTTDHYADWRTSV